MVLWLKALILLGVFLVLLGTLLMVFGLFAGRVAQVETETRAGGVVLIGPVPILFGSDRTMVFLGAVLTLVAILFWFFLVRGSLRF